MGDPTIDTPGAVVSPRPALGTVRPNEGATMLDTMSPAEVHADAVAHFAALHRISRRLALQWQYAMLAGDETAAERHARAADVLTDRITQAKIDMREAADALLAARGGRPLIP